MDLLAFLARHLTLTLAVLALLVLVIVIALVILARRRRVKPEEEAAEGAALEPVAVPAGGAVVVDFRHAGSHLRMGGAFRRALAELRRHLGAGGSRYRLPWYVLLGEQAAGKPDLFPDSGLNLPLGAPEEPAPDKGDGCAFWFFDRGVVLDVSGEYVLGSSGRTPNERGWRHFLGLLREHRPERPLDGVVVTIPCAGLMGEAEEEGGRLAAAAEKGETLFRRLRQAQEALGMNFPVYVLVTGCESVPGFESYVSEVPQHLRGDLFGWSSPYAPETAYHPEWLDEAFALMGTNLHRAQIEAFGDQAVLEDPDGVFCFPSELARLYAPLRVYLNQIFRASAYHELLPCRGIYFCGRLPESARGSSLLRDAGTVGGSVFVRDVFDRKVFPEHELARPTTLALLQGGRRLRGLQAAVVVLALISTLGIWWGGHRLRQRRDSLQPFLSSTRLDLLEILSRKRTGAVDPDLRRQRALSMLDRMAEIDGRWFGSVFIPSSWISPLNGNLQQAVARAYGDIIIPTLSEELDRKLDRLIDDAKPAPLAPAVEEQPAASEAAPADRFLAHDPGPAVLPASADLQPLEGMQELKDLNGYVGKLHDFAANVSLYDRLCKTESLQDLGQVVQFLFNHSLPPEFFQHSELYSHALALVDYESFDVEKHRPKTRQREADLGGALFDRLFERNPAMGDLQSAASLIEEVAGGGARAGDDLVSKLVELHGHLKRAGEELAAPELAWMGSEKLDLGPSWQQVQQEIRANPFLGPETADDLQKLGESRFQRLRRALLEIETRSTGRLVLRDAKSGRLGLSPEAKMLDDALEGFSRQGFVDTAEGAPAALPARGRVTWDTVALTQAAGLYKPYEDFIEKVLNPFPPDLRDTLQISARDRLGARMMEEIAKAQQAGPEPDPGSALQVEQALDAEVASFQAAAGPLNELAGHFSKLGLSEDSRQVTAAFAAQGKSILDDADRLLALRTPYTPRGGGFDWWKGGKRPALEAFAARDEAELAAYLTAQRNEVSDITSHYAEPVIAALGGKTSSRPLRAAISRWTAIGEQLRRYTAKEPGSSVANLEDFILKDLTEIDPASCSRHITTRTLAEPTPDFFLERRAALRREVWDRCLYLAGGQGAEGYRKLADFFNQRLAGRFPFAAAPPSRLDQEADPRDIRAFFQLWSVYAPAVKGVPEDDRPPGTGEFVDRMGSVRNLFAAFLDDPEHPEVPTFDLNVRFRENRRGEKGADQILRWSLASGEQVVSHPNPRPALPWTYGAPIRVELQWAKDSPVIPVESADLPGVHVRERTAVLEWRGHWALFALARALDDPAVPADPGVQMLRFQVATRPEADPKAKPEVARVYVSLAVRAPERREKTAGKDAAAASPAAVPVPAGDLELPAFPVSAPAWKTQKAEAP